MVLFMARLQQLQPACTTAGQSLHVSFVIWSSNVCFALAAIAPAGSRRNMLLSGVCCCSIGCRARRQPWAVGQLLLQHVPAEVSTFAAIALVDVYHELLCLAAIAQHECKMLCPPLSIVVVCQIMFLSGSPVLDGKQTCCIQHCQ
jgi:hypothetical protein